MDWWTANLSVGLLLMHSHFQSEDDQSHFDFSTRLVLWEKQRISLRNRKYFALFHPERTTNHLTYYATKQIPMTIVSLALTSAEWEHFFLHTFYRWLGDSICMQWKTIPKIELRWRKDIANRAPSDFRSRNRFESWFLFIWLFQSQVKKKKKKKSSTKVYIHR